MNAEVVNPPSRNRLLAALPPADFALIRPHLTHTALEQGSLLQEAGEPIEVVYFPQTGMVSVLAVMQGGEAIETLTVGSEGAVGAQAGLGSPRAGGRAVVQVKGVSSRMGAAEFRTATNASPALRELVIRYADLQMALVLQSVGCNALHPVEMRLCRWLLQTRDRSEGDTLTLTQEFLSEMLGVQRTTVTLLAGQLQDIGLLNTRRGQIEIVDRRGLETKACECYGVGHARTEAMYGEWSHRV